MGDKTGINWTNATWNPLVGCSIVSPGCINCYAMHQAARIQRMQPSSHYVGTTKQVNGNTVWTGVLKSAPEHIWEAPLRWQKPRKIFVNSMSDLFHENMPVEYIDRVFAVMYLASRHTFQVLTKRPAVMSKYLHDKQTPIRIAELVKSYTDRADIFGQAVRREGWLKAAAMPYKNVWLGVTVENQKAADERIPILMAVPAAIRFLSVEPLIGPVALKFVRCINGCGFISPVPVNNGKDYGCPECHSIVNAMRMVSRPGLFFYKKPIDWVIVGGESGDDARPMHPSWAENIMRECMTAGVPFFFKQWGQWQPDDGLLHAKNIVENMPLVRVPFSGGEFRRSDAKHTDAIMVPAGRFGNAVHRNIGGREFSEFPA